MSEVHEHEQAAVSPRIILDLTETTQELGTSLCSPLVPHIAVWGFCF